MFLNDDGQSRAFSHDHHMGEGKDILVNLAHIKQYYSFDFLYDALLCLSGLSSYKEEIKRKAQDLSRRIWLLFLGVIWQPPQGAAVVSAKGSS